MDFRFCNSCGDVCVGKIKGKQIDPVPVDGLLGLYHQPHHDAILQKSALLDVFLFEQLHILMDRGWETRQGGPRGLTNNNNNKKMPQSEKKVS